MRQRFLILLILIGSGTLLAQANPDTSFERSYLELEQKIKDNGQHLNDQSRNEIKDLLAQLNHQHAELKRELEKKDQQLREKLDGTHRTGLAWVQRLIDAWSEFAGGAAKAWGKLSQENE